MKEKLKKTGKKKNVKIKKLSILLMSIFAISTASIVTPCLIAGLNNNDVVEEMQPKDNKIEIIIDATNE